VRSQAHRLRAQLDRSRARLHVAPTNVRRAVGTALDLAGQPALVETGDGTAQSPPELKAGWERTVADLADPLSGRSCLMTFRRRCSSRPRRRPRPPRRAPGRPEPRLLRSAVRGGRTRRAGGGEPFATSGKPQWRDTLRLSVALEDLADSLRQEGGGCLATTQRRGAAQKSPQDMVHLVTDDRVGAPARPMHWSPAVALDPKHRPQVPFRPSTTVRREWWRWPQEAHLLDVKGARYRRLHVSEIARLQGFEPRWFEIGGVDELDRIRAIGDAVPPPLATAVIRTVEEFGGLGGGRSIEICAGSGGLALGAAAVGMQHELLVDSWPVSGRILKHDKPWADDRVVVRDAMDVDYKTYKGSVDLLSGGPPCQPWSNAGLGKGLADDRDLLGKVHKIIAAVEPTAFVLENVPGLLSEANRPYLLRILEQLRKPRRGLGYGVGAGVLNAADYGVPQRRRRLFFIGLRDAPSSRVFNLFDRLESIATHRDPSRYKPERKPWNPVGCVLDSNVHESEWFDWPYGGALDG
jgi:site-specific DNA-cytosine methylase